MVGLKGALASNTMGSSLDTVRYDEILLPAVFNPRVREVSNAKVGRALSKEGHEYPSMLGGQQPAERMRGVCTVQYSPVCSMLARHV
jgi:hypothetical protein